MQIAYKGMPAFANVIWGSNSESMNIAICVGACFLPFPVVHLALRPRRMLTRFWLFERHLFHLLFKVELSLFILLHGLAFGVLFCRAGTFVL